MKHWKQRDTDACPRCGQPEDESHVWKSQNQEACKVWQPSLQELEQWMIKANTAPQLREELLNYLSNWRNDSTLSPYILAPPFASQQECKWQSMIEGWARRSWVEGQHNYCSTIGSLRTGCRWLIEIIKKLWKVAWDQWEHRNVILHEQDNLVRDLEDEALNRKLSSTYQECRYLLPNDQGHFLLFLYNNCSL
jgi:hypothetical protein